MPKVEKKAPSHFIEDRLTALKSIKDKYGLSDKAPEWKEKANMKEVVSPSDENDFRTQVSATVKRQKDAELSANMPEWSFIPLTDEAQSNRKIVRESWKYHWLISNTDKVISKIVWQATTYGTGIQYEWIKHTHKTIKEPFIKKGKIEYREKEINESKIYCEKIPFANFFINWTDIDESTEAITITYYDKEEYIMEKETSPVYKNIGKLKKAPTDYTLSGITDWEDKIPNQDTENVVTEFKYYNTAKDEFRILANGVEILSTPIPYMHKKLPFVPYYDNEAEDRFWWIGEFELLENEERAKNEYRSLTVKWVKASIGFILKDRDNDLETDGMDYWIQEVYETDDMDGIEHFAPNVPIQAIAELEAKIDNDIIAKSGVDFKSLQLSPSESATRTANKSLSSKKRINKNIKDNWYGFFRRLGELRMANIQQLHMMNNVRVPIEWGSINNKWVFIPDETGSFGSGIIWEKFIKWQFLVLPITETMLWNNKQRRKENLSTFMQVAGNLVWEDGKPVIKWTQLAKLASDEYGYDYEKLTEEASEAQATNEIVDEVMNEGPQLPPEENPNNPNYVPPAQRSQRDQVKTISGQAKVPFEIDEA